MLQRLSRQPEPEQQRAPLLRQPYRAQCEAQLREEADPRPPRSYRNLVRDVLRDADNSDHVLLGTCGLDLRDPTADRRLVDFCLSVPASIRASNSRRRPVYERAFADRIPRQVMFSGKCGYQAADWFRQIDADDLRDAFATYAKHPFVSELVDCGAMEAHLAGWNEMDPHSRLGNMRYRIQLLRTFATASFVAKQIG